MSSEQSSTAGGANARNISAQEIQREMATLRSLRRRSASSGGPGALPLDPDLPPPAGMVVHATSPPKSGTGPYTHQHQHYHLHDDQLQLGEYSTASPLSPVSPTKSGGPSRSYEYENDREREFDRFPQSHELDPDKPIMAQGEARLAGILPSAPSDDPRHLYWVPAHLHPELAPTEFREFLKAHAHPDSPGAEDAQGGIDAGEAFAHRGALMAQNGAGSGPGLARSPSWLARAGANGTGMVAGLARRASSLREDSQRPSPSGLASPVSLLSPQNPPSMGGGGSLNRKRSMLSRQYHPRPNDNIENEPPPLPTHREGALGRSLSRSGSRGEGIYGGAMGEQNVTLEDLQKLESIADEAAETGDPAVMRTLLKRSLSLNFSADLSDSAVVEGHPEVALSIDEQDSPILLSQTGSIMRRNAGTRRIRERGSGVGSRLASSRRPKARGSTESDDVAPTSPVGSHVSSTSSAIDARSLAAPTSPAPDRDGFADTGRRPSNSSEMSDEMYSAESGSGGGAAGASALDDRRPSSASTEESSIYDAYTTTDTQADTSVESSISSTSYGGMDSSSEDYYRPSGSKQDVGSEKHGYGSTSAGYLEPDREYGRYDAEQYESEGERTPTSKVSDDFARFRIFVGEGPQQQQQQQQQSPQPVEPTRHSDAPPSPPETVKSQVHTASEKAVPPKQYSSPQPPAPQSAVQAKPTPKVDLAPPPLKLLKTKPSIDKLKVKSEKKGGLFSKNKDKDKSKKSEKKEEKGFLGSLFGSKKKQEDNTPSKFSQEGKATAAALLGTSKSAKSLGLIPMQGGSPTTPGFAPYARYPIHVERAVYRLSHIKLANPRRPLYEQVLISNLMFWYLSIINKPATPAVIPPTQQKEAVVVPASQESEKVTAAGARPTITRNALTSTPPANTKVPGPTPASEASAKRTSLSKPEQRGQSRPRSAETPIRSPQYGMQNLQMEQEYGSRGSQNQRPTAAQQAPPAVPAQQQQQPPPAVPSARRAPPPNPIITNLGPANQTPLSPRNAQPPYDHEPPLMVDKPRRTSSNAPPPMENGRRNYPDRPQQAVEPAYQSQLPYQQQPERREPPRPRQAYPQHSGPQPGQVFQYPNNMLNVKPGQVFPSGPRSPVGTQPGQVFQHPQYTNNAHYNPQPYEQSEARLPPGAINPRQSSQDPSRNAQLHGQIGPRGGSVQSNVRRAASNGDSYHNEYPNSVQPGGGNRSISASANMQYDPRAQQARHGAPPMTMRTPSPQPPSANHDPSYIYRQPIPGHYEARR